MRSSIVCAAMLLAASAAAAQPASRAGRSPAAPRALIPAVTATTAIAVRARVAPIIDGRDDDAVWKTAPVIDGFRTFDPVEDGDPRFRTEARVLYDERSIYVLVRAFDSHPDSIAALLSRRDVHTASDQIKVMIDAHHDRRSGFEFAVNPAGVKRDFAIYNDNQEDASWDGVWDVATRIDSLGWIAEFRIPLSQLRYPERETHTFGFGIWRDVARHNERYSWPLFRRSESGLASQLGEIRGISGLASPRRMEVVPYTVGKTANAPNVGAGIQNNSATMGADMKYGITSNLTLDATVNPDFGQVEADPSVLNLSAFETFFPERRPFFLEGQGLFRFDVNCNDGQCSGLFYSRRIGRSPQLAGTYEDPDNATASTILGAGKLTGRLRNGMSVGVLNAATQREVSPGGETIEPRANYFVGRAQQDFRQGASAVGVMATNVRRNVDSFSSAYLRSDATAAGVDARHQFLDRRFEIAGYYAVSRVEGSPEAISATQLSSVHLYQRPDGPVAYDPTRTRLDGYSAQVAMAKRTGDFTRGSAGVQLLSPGFEINDVGFLSRASAITQWAWFQVRFPNPKPLYRFGNVNFNQWSNYDWAGMRTELGGNINTHWQLPNGMWLRFGQGGNALVPSYCDNCTRGGPAVRMDRALWGWGGIEGDSRRTITPYFFTNWMRGNGGRSSNISLSPSMQVRIASRFSTTLGYDASHSIRAAQFAGNFGDIGSDTIHYTSARLDQWTHALTARASFTATPTLSLQVYAQPFATRGDFSNWVELADPRAPAWDDRYRPYDGGDPGAFDFKQFRSNTVLRWEYRPGSTLFFVWAQERAQSVGGAAAREVPHGIGELRRTTPANVFLIKGSYWLSL